MNQFQDTQAFIRWNEEMARKYDSEAYHLRANFLIRWIEQRRVRVIADFLQLTAAHTLLEVGCGAGIVLSQMVAGHLIGMDLSAFILQKTRHRVRDLLQGNAERLPFASNSFDHLLCTEVIEHVQSPRRVVQELARIATPQGKVVITIPNEALIDGVKGWIQRLGLGRWLLQGETAVHNGYDSPAGGNEWHLHRFDLPLLRTVIADELEIVRLRAIPCRWLPFRYVVLCRKLMRR